MLEVHEGLSPRIEAIGEDVVDSALAVHRALGPGLLESVYEMCLARELEKRGHRVDRQLSLPVLFNDLRMEAGFRLDLLVDQSVIIEVKAVDALIPIHDAQLLTYLRLSSRRLGFLINFNVPLLKQGIRRKIN